MQRKQSAVIGGVGLIVVGVALMLQNPGFIDDADSWGGVWALPFAGGGVALFWIFLKHQDNWWALIPGFTLLGLATLVGMDFILPEIADLLGASIFLAAIGLGFWAVYFVRHDQWWAIIPGGALLSIALLVFAEQFLGGDVAGIFFLGLSTTFALVAALPNAKGNMSWAWIPAGVLFAMGMLIAAPFIYLLPIVGAVSLLVVGGYMLTRTVRTD